MTIMQEHGLNIPPITLATRLRLAREWREIEQADLAKELGLSRASISSYENGRTSPNKLAINAWAVLCDVDVEWLRTGKPSEINDPDGGNSNLYTPRDSNPEPTD